MYSIERYIRKNGSPPGLICSMSLGAEPKSPRCFQLGVLEYFISVIEDIGRAFCGGSGAAGKAEAVRRLDDQMFLVLLR